MTTAEWVRGVIIALTAVVFLLFFVRLWTERKNMRFGKKALLVGCLLMMFALASRAVISIMQGEPLVWPLIPFTLGVVCFAIYLTEPAASRHRDDGL